MEEISNIEREAQKESPIHNLDGRIKLIITFTLIAYAVSTSNVLVLLLMEAYLLLLIIVSNVSLKYALKRLVLMLPFGGFIALFQPFIRPGDIIWVGPLGLQVTLQGLEFGILLLAKITVSVTAIILLSSTTSMQEMVGAARKIGVPGEFAMLLSLTLRYLFFFYDELQRIRNAQKTRCFDIWSKKTAYKWRLKKVAETIAMMFLRAYEQGEKVYLSMLSRGYSSESRMYHAHYHLHRKDLAFVLINIVILTALYLLQPLLLP